MARHSIEPLFLKRIREKRTNQVAESDWRRQHDEVSTTIRRVMIALVAYSLFCLLTLGAPDKGLIAADATIGIPFANTAVSYVAFLIVGPLILIGLLMYLHIFVGASLILGAREHKDALPFIFNMKKRLPMMLSHFLFYWLSPIVLLVFMWKASPRPYDFIMLNFLFFLVLALLLALGLLQSGRLPKSKILRYILLLAVIVFIPSTVMQVFGQIVDQHRHLNLSDEDLSGLDLTSVQMVNARISNANLKNARLFRANLYGAKLEKSTLNGAILHHALMRRAHLDEANLEKADLMHAYLVEASLINARLNRAVLLGTRLDHARLSGANLFGADLTRSYMHWVDLQGADLRATKFWDTSLRGANLSYAKLTDIDFPKIIDIKQALISEDAPTDFKEWALENGATLDYFEYTQWRDQAYQKWIKLNPISVTRKYNAIEVLVNSLLNFIGFDLSGMKI